MLPWKSGLPIRDRNVLDVSWLLHDLAKSSDSCIFACVMLVVRLAVVLESYSYGREDSDCFCQHARSEKILHVACIVEDRRKSEEKNMAGILLVAFAPRVSTAAVTDLSFGRS